MNDELQKQLIADLLAESFEGLDRFDQELLAVENGTGNAETLNVIFRVIHSLKGTAGCIGLTRIESIAHGGENLLSLLREGKVTVSKELISTLLALSDCLRGVLREIESSGQEGIGDDIGLIERLHRLQNPPSSRTATPPVFGLFDEPDAPAPAVERVNPHAAPPPTPSPENGPNKASVSPTGIRVDVAQLDKLMNLVGELVLARNQIVQNAALRDPAALQAASQRLNLITTELQESVMKTRMQPIETVWAKFPRVVRDVASELEKQVHLELFGHETELDRTIIEAIKDPLTHVVRNAIDHGIELPAKRLAQGKPAQGSLFLRAYHEGGQVNIEISDDGAGINLEKVKQKAVERGLITADNAARLSEREAMNLIFAPGLSTAEKVTNISGRGVGMDVVKTNIEKIGGSIDIKSELGQGTTLKIRIPLTLAIIPALIVTSGGDRFAIPQVSLLELVRIKQEDTLKSIENLYGVPVYRLRGQLLPLCYLNKVLKIESSADQRATASADATNIVVLQADGRQFGLVVDRINDTEEIVVKPLGKQLKSITCFAGATIMGDGRVALILDVLGLAQHANIITEIRERVTVDANAQNQHEGLKQTLLIFEGAVGSRLAVPLSSVARLEEFQSSRIELSNGQCVIQYRGEILPLLPVSDSLVHLLSLGAKDHPIQVVVYTEGARSVGLVVGQITDIVEEAFTVQTNRQRVGFLGSAVVQNKVTDLIDVAALVRSSDLSAFAVSAA